MWKIRVPTYSSCVLGFALMFGFIQWVVTDDSVEIIAKQRKKIAQQFCNVAIKALAPR